MSVAGEVDEVRTPRPSSSADASAHAPSGDPFARLRRMAILNLVDDPLVALQRKGFLAYAPELYNPGDAFGAVHHISFNNLGDAEAEKRIELGHRIQIHVLKTTRPWLRGLWPLVDLPWCLWQIYRIGRRHRVRLIRGRGPSYASFFGVTVARWLRVPCVVSIGGDHRLARDLTGRYPIFNLRMIDRWIERCVLQRADRALCPNEFSRRYALRMGARPDRAVVLPLRLPEGIRSLEAAPAEALERLGVRLDEPIILFLGRFERDKQVDVLIEALPPVARQVPQAQFLFVGDGSLWAPLRARAEALGCSASCRFVGFQPAPVIKRCLQAASVVWVPMSGWVVYEAAAAAKPIVAFDVEWHGEFVEDGVTGRLVPNRDHRAMAEAVVALLRDPEAASRLGRAARRLLDERYDPSLLVRRELEVVSGCLAERRG